MNCPAATGHIVHQLQQNIDVYDLCKHVNEFTHSKGALDFVITQLQNPKVSSTITEELDVSDDSMMIIHLPHLSYVWHVKHLK